MPVMRLEPRPPTQYKSNFLVTSWCHHPFHTLVNWWSVSSPADTYNLDNKSIHIFLNNFLSTFLRNRMVVIYRRFPLVVFSIQKVYRPLASKESLCWGKFILLWRSTCSESNWLGCGGYLTRPFRDQIEWNLQFSMGFVPPGSRIHHMTMYYHVRGEGVLIYCREHLDRQTWVFDHCASQALTPHWKKNKSDQTFWQ